MTTAPASPDVMSRSRADVTVPPPPPPPRVLSLADIVNAPHAIEDVHVKEFPGAVFRIRSLSSDEMTFYQGLCKRLTDGASFDFVGVRETLVAMSLVDGDGTPIWAEVNPATPDSFTVPKTALGKMPHAVVETLFQAIQTHNGLNADDDDVEDMAGN